MLLMSVEIVTDCPDYCASAIVAGAAKSSPAPRVAAMAAFLVVLMSFIKRGPFLCVDIERIG